MKKYVGLTVSFLGNMWLETVEADNEEQARQILSTPGYKCLLVYEVGALSCEIVTASSIEQAQRQANVSRFPAIDK